MLLSDRMKKYENVTNTRLVPRLPIIVRIDGRAFHTFCRNMNRPYDCFMSSLMLETTKYLVDESNAVIGYTQSDEINLILYNGNPQSESMFDGRTQKLCSILAALATAKFNRRIFDYFDEKNYITSFPVFDCRVFNVPCKSEAVNVLVWRELDATRNSITMAAQSQYSHNELMNKNTDQMQEMLFQKGINWNDYPTFFKRGTYVRRLPYESVIGNVNVIRNKIEELDLPPIQRIVNKIEVIFDNQPPILRD